MKIIFLIFSLTLYISGGGERNGFSIICIYKRLSAKTHIMIQPDTVGPGLTIYHIGAFTYVKKNAKIGKTCTILQGVVFGDKSGVEERVIVGDNCSFGLDAKILGSLTIGNNVKVGANAVVTKNIPDNAIVGGVPAKIIKIQNENS